MPRKRGSSAASIPILLFYGRNRKRRYMMDIAIWYIEAVILFLLAVVGLCPGD